MRLLMDFLRNLVLLIIIGLVLLFLFPDTMKQVIQIYGALLGPVAILVLIAAALPRKKRK